MVPSLRKEFFFFSLFCKQGALRERELFTLSLNLDDQHTIEALLELKVIAASARLDDAAKFTPLHIVRSAVVVNLLVAHGAEVNARRQNGMTPLMDACQNGAADVVRALCEHGADMNLKDVPGGVGALHYAERRRDDKPTAASITNGASSSSICSSSTSSSYTFSQAGSAGSEVGSVLHLFALGPGTQPWTGTASAGRPRTDAERALDEFRTAPLPADGAACARVLHAFGVRTARCSREEWLHANLEAPEDMPDEYVVGFH